MKRHAVLTCGYTSYPQVMSELFQIKDSDIKVINSPVDKKRNTALTCGYTNGLDRRVYAGRIQWQREKIMPKENDYYSFSVLKDKEIKINKKTLLLFIVASLIYAVIGASPVYAHQHKSYKDYLKLYAHMKIVNADQYECFNAIVEKESRWSPAARNGSHYGLGQMRSKWYGKLNPYKQIDTTIQYIAKRYGSSCNALAFHHRKGWY